MNAFSNAGKHNFTAGQRCSVADDDRVRLWPSGLPPLMELKRTLESHHSVKLSLCTALESIADKLPDEADTMMCGYVARSITPVVRRAHEFEERELFPVLRSGVSPSRSLLESLDKLVSEHTEDLSFAEEIEDVLSSFIENPAQVNADTLGYMLRGFFEGLRRHIEFERIAVMSVLSEFEG